MRREGISEPVLSDSAPTEDTAVVTLPDAGTLHTTRMAQPLPAAAGGASSAHCPPLAAEMFCSTCACAACSSLQLA